jgi:glucose dehydrogenase
MRYGLAILLILLIAAIQMPDKEWTEYLGGPDRNHYSPLDQVNRSNVGKLKKAWEYHTGDTSGQMQCNPIIVDGLLYGTTASVEVFALESATGKEVWRFRNSGDVKWYSLSRGVMIEEFCSQLVNGYTRWMPKQGDRCTALGIVAGLV